MVHSSVVSKHEGDVGLLLLILVVAIISSVVSSISSRIDRRRRIKEKIDFEAALRSGYIPPAWLRAPERAAARFGEGAIDLWSAFVEPKHRFGGRHPVDWNWRRYAVMRRDGGRCTFCTSTRPRLHVHHRVPVASGGCHALGNLRTLCTVCHKRIHRAIRIEDKREATS
jgi:hypothetical protein